jgi:hypothetical protein
MHHPILFVLGMFLLARLLFRRARCRRLGYAGPCGRLRGRRGPIDLGAPDDDTDGRDWLERRAIRWTQRWERGRRVSPSPPSTPAPPVVDVAGALELNPRQRTLFEDVMAKAKSAVPTSTVAAALAAVAREPFSRDSVERMVGPGDLADDLLQLHHSLTSEQRAKLREVTGV